MIKRFTLNTTGRDLVCGDIHGHFTKLQAALDYVKFDPAVDRLFSVGDLVDRGPESPLALQWLAKPWFHAIAGNHEVAAVAFADGVMNEAYYRGAFGGGWNIDNGPEERAVIASAFRALPIAMEIETDAGLVGIVHAECPISSWQEFTEKIQSTEPSFERQHLIDMAQWSRARADSENPKSVEGVIAVVVGHTPMQRMTSLGNHIYIDTGAWLPEHRGGGEFTLLDAATLQALRLPATKVLSWPS